MPTVPGQRVRGVRRQRHAAMGVRSSHIAAVAGNTARDAHEQGRLCWFNQILITLNPREDSLRPSRFRASRLDAVLGFASRLDAVPGFERHGLDQSVSPRRGAKYCFSPRRGLGLGTQSLDQSVSPRRCARCCFSSRRGAWSVSMAWIQASRLDAVLGVAFHLDAAHWIDRAAERWHAAG